MGNVLSDAEQCLSRTDDQPTAYILKTLFQLGTEGHPPSPVLVNTVLIDSVSHSNRQERETPGMQTGEEVKWVLFARNMVFCRESPNDSITITYTEERIVQTGRINTQ